MGMYSHLKGELDPWPQDQTWQQEINRAKSQHNGKSLGDLAKRWYELRTKKDELNEQLGKINTEIEAVSQLTLGKMEEDGITNVRLDGGRGIRLNDEPYCSVKDRQAFFEWVRENKREDMFTIHFQTTNSLVKQRLMDGEPLPPGLKAFLKTSLRKM